MRNKRKIIKVEGGYVLDKGSRPVHGGGRKPSDPKEKTAAPAGDGTAANGLSKHVRVVIADE